MLTKQKHKQGKHTKILEENLDADFFITWSEQLIAKLYTQDSK